MKQRNKWAVNGVDDNLSFYSNAYNSWLLYYYYYILQNTDS